MKILIAMLIGSIALAKMEGPIGQRRPKAAPPATKRTREQIADKLIGAARKSSQDVSIQLSPETNKKNPIPLSGITPSGRSSGAKSKVYFDEYAAKGEKRRLSAIDDSEAAKRSEHRNPPGGDSSNKPAGIPQRFDRMWPICFFIDPSVGNGNQIVKGVSDMAAKCKVNVVAFPFYIQPNYPKDANALNAAAKRSCNAIPGMAQLGITRASAVTLVGKSRIAGQLCSSKGSCSELGFSTTEGQRARMQATGTWGGQANAGETAAAIVGPPDLNAATVAGRVQGQAQMGLPWGAFAGNGTGDFGEGYATAGSSPEPGWSDFGCQKMRELSFPNTGNFKWLPTQENYVMLGKTLWDVTGERTIFNVANNSGGGSPPPTSAHPAKSAALSDNYFKPEPGATKDIVPTGNAASEDGHKLRSTQALSTAVTVSNQPQPKIEATKQKPKIGGQLNAMDNTFMGEKQQSLSKIRTQPPEPKANGISRARSDRSPGSARGRRP